MNVNDFSETKGITTITGEGEIQRHPELRQGGSEWIATFSMTTKLPEEPIPFKITICDLKGMLALLFCTNEYAAS